MSWNRYKNVTQYNGTTRLSKNAKKSSKKRNGRKVPKNENEVRGEGKNIFTANAEEKYYFIFMKNAEEEGKLNHKVLCKKMEKT